MARFRFPLECRCAHYFRRVYLGHPSPPARCIGHSGEKQERAASLVTSRGLVTGASRMASTGCAVSASPGPATCPPAQGQSGQSRRPPRSCWMGLRYRTTERSYFSDPSILSLTDGGSGRPQTGVTLNGGELTSHLTMEEGVPMLVATTTRPRPVVGVLRLARLTHRAEVMVQNLSGNEKPLGLAIAPLSRLEILFLDEPAAGQGARRHADSSARNVDTHPIAEPALTT